VPGHENTSAASRGWAFSSQSLDGTIAVDLVVFQYRHLDFLAFVFDLLGGSVSFFLSLLGTTTEPQDQVEGRLLLDVVVGQSAAVLKLLTGEDQSLLVRRDAFLLLNLSLDIVDRVGGLDLKGDSLTGEGLDEDLHLAVSGSYSVVREVLGVPVDRKLTRPG